MVYTCKVLESDPNESKLIKHYGYFEDGKQIAKCAMKLYSRGDNAGTYLLMGVEVKASHRGKGLCGKFLKCVLKRYSGKVIFLDVLIDNTPAVKCYESLGFVEIERGRSTLWMRKA
jgi:predicted GNAT family acetyltransferase